MFLKLIDRVMQNSNKLKIINNVCTMYMVSVYVFVQKQTLYQRLLCYMRIIRDMCGERLQNVWVIGLVLVSQYQYIYTVK